VILINVVAAIIQLAMLLMVYRTLINHFRPYIVIEPQATAAAWMMRNIGVGPALEIKITQVDPRYHGSGQDDRVESDTFNDRELALYLEKFNRVGDRIETNRFSIAGLSLGDCYRISKIDAKCQLKTKKYDSGDLPGRKVEIAYRDIFGRRRTYTYAMDWDLSPDYQVVNAYSFVDVSRRNWWNSLFP
jgi:hypothetical protein